MNGPFITEHTAVIYQKCIFYFGGCNPSHLNTLYKYDISRNTIESVHTIGKVPGVRSAHTAVIYENSMYVFGGWNGYSSYGDLCKLNLETMYWSQVETTGEAPCNRRTHGAAVHENHMYIFGGYGESQKPSYFDQLFSYNFDTREWKIMESNGQCPPGRSRMSLTEHNGKLYLLGGWDRVKYFAELYQYEIEKKTWRKIDTNFCEVAEGPIGQHVAVVYKNWLLVFGGYSPLSPKYDCRGDTYVMKLD